MLQDGTADIVVIFYNGLGENHKAGVRTITNKRELRFAEYDRQEYLEILHKYQAQFSAAWTASGRSVPQASYRTHAGKFIYMPPFYVGLDCEATVLAKYGNKADLSATFQEGRGWSLPKGALYLTDVEFSRDFKPLRLAYCLKLGEYAEKARLEWLLYLASEAD